MEGYLAQVIMFGSNFAPLGWAFCQGQLIAISQNTALFSLVGTTYGGNGTVTFGLPDLRSRAPMGAGQGPGLPNVSLGEMSGVENITLLISNLPPHTHPVTPVVKVASTNATTDEPAGAVLTTSDNNNYAAPAAANGNLAAGTLTLSPSGSGQPLSIRQPYIGINFIICTSGFFPSRN